MSILDQPLGTCGLIETFVLIVYGSSLPRLRKGSFAPLTFFEYFIFKLLAGFELAGYGVMLLSLQRILCGMDRTSADCPDNVKTVSRDVLHNLVHPRSEEGSRMRRDFAALAWAGVLVSGLPVLILIPIYPVWGWGNHAETPRYTLVTPSVIGVLAVVEAIVGWTYLDKNRSSYVVTVLYLNTKFMSLVLLFSGYNRLLVGSEWDGNFPTGLFLAIMQIIKLASGIVAVRGYLVGKPDENMPKFNSLCGNCHA